MPSRRALLFTIIACCAISATCMLILRNWFAAAGFASAAFNAWLCLLHLREIELWEKAAHQLENEKR